MKLDMVGIVVNDIKQATAFYELLDFKVSGDVTENYVELLNQGVRLSLNSVEMIEEVYGFRPTISGDKIELAFLCETASELDSYCEKIATAGYEIYKQPWNAFWGQRYAMIRDADGNLLSLFSNERGRE